MEVGAFVHSVPAVRPERGEALASLHAQALMPKRRVCRRMRVNFERGRRLQPLARGTPSGSM